jgi:hypothetical protein
LRFGDTRDFANDHELRATRNAGIFNLIEVRLKYVLIREARVCDDRTRSIASHARTDQSLSH